MDAIGAHGFYVEITTSPGEEYFIDLDGCFWGVDPTTKTLFRYGPTHYVPRILVCQKVDEDLGYWRIYPLDWIHYHGKSLREVIGPVNDDGTIHDLFGYTAHTDTVHVEVTGS